MLGDLRSGGDTGGEVEWLPLELKPHPALSSAIAPDYVAVAWSGSVAPMADQLRITIKQPSGPIL